MDPPRPALTPPVLISSPWNTHFATTPVVDRDHIETVVAAFFEAIRRTPELPKLIQLAWMEAETPVFTVMRRQLGRWHYREYERDPRPFVDLIVAPPKQSGSTRQNLRRHWKRLLALPGGADISNERFPPEVVQGAFEVFLKMEEKQWKGAQGTAILSRPQNALVSRKMVENLANEGNASVAVLRVGGEPVATQVLFYCGRKAYTWKTAFDSRYSEYSPGTVLVDGVTSRMLGNGEVSEVDSCSYSTGFMARIWEGRHDLVRDAVIDLHSSVSAALVQEAFAWELYRVRRRIRMRIWPAIKKMASSAISRMRKKPMRIQPGEEVSPLFSQEDR
jgi:hypothetical protein